MKETCLTQSTTVANLTTEFLRKFAYIERRNEKKVVELNRNNFPTFPK